MISLPLIFCFFVPLLMEKVVLASESLFRPANGVLSTCLLVQITTGNLSTAVSFTLRTDWISFFLQNKFVSSCWWCGWIWLAIAQPMDILRLKNFFCDLIHQGWTPSSSMLWAEILFVKLFFWDISCFLLAKINILFYFTCWHSTRKIT